jgi:hypothetical protein
MQGYEVGEIALRGTGELIGSEDRGKRLGFRGCAVTECRLSTVPLRWTGISMQRPVENTLCPLRARSKDDTVAEFEIVGAGAQVKVIDKMANAQS